MEVGIWRHHEIQSSVLWAYALTKRTNLEGKDDLQMGVAEAAIELVEWFNPQESEVIIKRKADIHVDRAHHSVRVFGNVLTDATVQIWVQRIR